MQIFDTRDLNKRLIKLETSDLPDLDSEEQEEFIFIEIVNFNLLTVG